MFAYLISVASLVTPTFAEQQPTAAFFLSPPVDVTLALDGLQPNSLVAIEITLESGATPIGAAHAPRPARLHGWTDPLGGYVRIFRGAQPALTGGALTARVQGLVAGTSWTSTAVLMGADHQAFEPVFVEQGVSKLPATAESLGGAFVAAGDLDSNGSVDLVLSAGDSLHAWVQGAGGGLSDRTLAHLVQPGHAVGQLALAEMNGGGGLDLIVAGDPASGQPDRIWFNALGLRLPGPALAYAGAVATSAFVPGDFDGDGRVDLAVLRGDTNHATVGERDSLYLQAPSGAFLESAAFAGASWNEAVSATTGGVARDFDGDGDLDLFLTKADPASSTGSPGAYNVLLVNQGDGLFVDASSSALFPHAKDNSYQGEAVDIDGDGDQDLVVANSLLGVGGSASSDVLINQGGFQGGTAGVFFDAPGLLPETPPVYEAIRLLTIAADFNLDGIGDVFFGVHDLPPGNGGHPLFLGKVAGGGVLERASHFESGTFIAAGGAAFDLEGDGDLDLILTSGGSAGGGQTPSRTRLFVNETR